MITMNPNKYQLMEKEQLEDRIRRFDSSKIETYLESLLDKCLDSLINEDYSTYENTKLLLNETILKIAPLVKNFHVFYNDIKLRIAAKHLKKLLDVPELDILSDINIVPNTLTFQDVQQLVKTKEFLEFEKHYNYFGYEHMIVENKAYALIIQTDEILKIILKHSNEIAIGTEIGIGEGCLDYHDELEVLKAFITNSETKEPDEETYYLNLKKELAAIKRYEEHYERWERHNDKYTEIRQKEDGTYYIHSEKIFEDPYFKEPLESEIYYNKENENFLVIMDTYHLVIYDKRKTFNNRIVLYISTTEREFLYKFSDYCLGLTPKPLEEESDPEEDEDIVEGIIIEKEP